MQTDSSPSPQHMSIVNESFDSRKHFKKKKWPDESTNRKENGSWREKGNAQEVSVVYMPRSA